VPVLGITDASTVSCKYSHCCALRSGGSLTCWGTNGLGQLGSSVPETTCWATTSENTKDGTLCWPVPVDVLSISDVVQVSTGYQSTCALRRDGAVYCWGGNEWGQLGNGTSVDSTTPARVTSL
jgi:alpha-tubulin suppressor-like RCC1 family protein